MAAGVTTDRLRRLARTGVLHYRGSAKDPLFRLSDIASLEPTTSLELPDWLVSPRQDSSLAELQDGRPPGTVPAYADNTVVCGHALDVLGAMPPSIVTATICSPPYWGQRVYEDETRVRWGDGTYVAFGREATPEEYVLHTLEILKGLLRVLRPDGTVWWNIADTYMTRTIMRTSSAERVQHYAGARTTWAGNPHRRTSAGHPDLKDKDLTLIPFHIAVGAQKLGYWVRSVIVWSKQQAADDYQDLPAQGGREIDGDRAGPRAHVPEVVLDRPVTGHEYILLLARSERYSYYPSGPLERATDATAVNVRSVWTFPPVATQGNHGARFPEELPRRCILLGSNKEDLIFDPFAGQATTLRLAHQLGRRYFGCDISPTYVREAKMRLAQKTLFPVPNPAAK